MTFLNINMEILDKQTTRWFFKIRWRYMLLLNSNAHLKNIAFNSKQ